MQLVATRFVVIINTTIRIKPVQSKSEIVASHVAMMQFDCNGLAEEWDQSDHIRARLRDGLPLADSIQKSRDASIAQCIKNVEVLNPLLHKFYACGLKLPEIDPLREQVSKVYSLSSRTPAEDTVDDDGWELKKMLRLVKRKANRGDVSTDFQL